MTCLKAMQDDMPQSNAQLFGERKGSAQRDRELQLPWRPAPQVPQQRASSAIELRTNLERPAYLSIRVNGAGLIPKQHGCQTAWLPDIISVRPFDCDSETWLAEFGHWRLTVTGTSATDQVLSMKCSCYDHFVPSTI